MIRQELGAEFHIKPPLHAKCAIDKPYCVQTKMLKIPSILCLSHHYEIATGVHMEVIGEGGGVDFDWIPKHILTLRLDNPLTTTDYG